MKYFVVSDVHGFYMELIETLNSKGFDKENKEHVLVSCGDLFDRGAFPTLVLEYIMSLPEERRILIRGNHEDLLEELLNKTRKPSMCDLRNGTIATVTDIAMGMDDPRADYDWESAIDTANKNKLLKDYLKAVQDYKIIGNYVFVHGWLPLNPNKTILQPSFCPDAWKKARWENGMDCAFKGKTLPNKTIICGHFHCSYGHKTYENKGTEYGKDADFSPYRAPGIIAIDSCVAYTGKINCIVIKDGIKEV